MHDDADPYIDDEGDDEEFSTTSQISMGLHYSCYEETPEENEPDGHYSCYEETPEENEPEPSS